MANERKLHAVDRVDPIWRLWEQLPTLWHGPVIGPGIDEWQNIGQSGRQWLNLTGLPGTVVAELAWMAHWQAQDGTRLTVGGFNHLAAILRWAMRDGHPFPASVRAMDWQTASALQGWYYATRWRRLPLAGSRNRLRAVFGSARLALLARCHDGPWWELDDWNPRCDPRIPLTSREPMANHGCSPSQITVPWLRTAVKWCLGTMLESGTLRWGTLVQMRLPSLRRFDTWLTTCLDDPRQAFGDPATARQHAAAFARWAADPRNRITRQNGRRFLGKPVHPRMVNHDLRAIAELFAFVAANPAEARAVLGVGPWQQVTDTHAASWFRQLSRIPRGRELNDEHYVDDHAVAQITAALPLLGLSRDQQMLITRGDGQQVTNAGLGDPQAMRMILLQILTGRRASEIRTCDLDCIEPVTDATATADDEPIARFRYAQSKIDTAPDSILVDREVTTIIEEQQRWVCERFPDLTPRHLFIQRLGNRHGSKPYSRGSYNAILSRFSDLVQPAFRSCGSF